MTAHYGNPRTNEVIDSPCERSTDLQAIPARIQHLFPHSFALPRSELLCIVSPTTVIPRSRESVTIVVKDLPT